MKKKYKNIKLVIYKKKKGNEPQKLDHKNYLRPDLIELYKATILEYNKTREINWKFNLSFWILLIIATYFKSLHPEVFNTYLTNLLFLIGLLAYYIFVYITQRSLAGNRRILNDYLEYLNIYDRVKNIVIDNTKYDRRYVLTLTDYLWIAFQIIITFFILLIFLQI